jgi:hypothetical protein
VINPSTNEATTRMMVAIAQAALDQENLEQPADRSGRRPERQYSEIWCSATLVPFC